MDLKLASSPTYLEILSSMGWNRKKLGILLRFLKVYVSLFKVYSSDMWSKIH